MFSVLPTDPTRLTSGGIYIHVPFCITRCHYCAFVTNPYASHLDTAFTDAVVQEINLWERTAGSGMIPENLFVNSLYFGGGTPSLLKPKSIGKIIDNLVRAFKTDSCPEITVEFNPGASNRHSLASLRTAGVNRVSLGVQSLDDRDLKRMGRSHTAAQALSTFWDLRSSGFSNISVDLLAGFPGQTMSSFSRSLELALGLGPEHLSIYLFELKPGARISALLRQGRLPQPDDDLAADMYDHVCSATHEAGYTHYEISNFSLPGKACVHNLGYWQDRIYLGFGPGAHGMTGGHRYSNLDDVDSYFQSLRAGTLPIGTLTSLDPMTRFKDALIMGCRLVAGLDINTLGRRYGVDALAFVNKTTEDLETAGLLSIQDGRLSLTHRGRLLSNHVFCRWV